MFTISFILYLKNKTGRIIRIWLESVFIPGLLNNPVGSCSLINRDFVLSLATHFDKIVFFPFLCLCNFWVYTFCCFFFLHFKEYHNIVSRLDWSLCGSVGVFSRYFLNTLFTKTNSSWLMMSQLKLLKLRLLC